MAERTDGLTSKQELALVKKAGGKLKSWDTEHIMPDGRTMEEYGVDVIAQTLVGGDTEEKLSAVDLMLKMKNQNIMMARLEAMDGDGEEEEKGKVVIILPPNGTERIG